MPASDTADPFAFPPVALRRGGFVVGRWPGRDGGEAPWNGPGLYTAEGAPDPTTAVFMPRGEFLHPERIATAGNLPEALFCGRFKPHFGHFVAESIGRLWATEAVGPDMPLVFFAEPRSRNLPGQTAPEMLRLLGVPNPVVTVRDVLRVERLHVPPTLYDPVFGIHSARAFRDWVCRRLDRTVPPAEAADLYLTRRALGDKLGRYLGEAAVEAGLEAEGYRVFAPETAPLAEQIARYRAARRIVMAESSAIHLLALLDVPGQRIAILKRRPRTVATLPPTLASLSRAQGMLVDRIDDTWIDPADTVPAYRAVSTLDMTAVWADLEREGFVASARAKPVPTAREVEDERLTRAANRTRLWRPKAP